MISDVQSTFGTLGDVLSVIPSVDVDPDGVVSLRGDTNVLILIDGKPSTQFSGTAAGDNLQSIPAKRHRTHRDSYHSAEPSSKPTAPPG